MYFFKRYFHKSPLLIILIYTGLLCLQTDLFAMQRINCYPSTIEKHEFFVAQANSLQLVFTVIVSL